MPSESEHAGQLPQAAGHASKRCLCMDPRHQRCVGKRTGWRWRASDSCRTGVSAGRRVVGILGPGLNRKRCLI